MALGIGWGAYCFDSAFVSLERWERRTIHSVGIDLPASVSISITYHSGEAASTRNKRPHPRAGRVSQSDC